MYTHCEGKDKNSPLRKWNSKKNKIKILGASLVMQWLRIHLPVQGHRFEPWSRKIPHAAEQLSL